MHRHKKCKHCGKKNHHKARTCHHCGKPLLARIGDNVDGFGWSAIHRLAELHED